MKIKAIDGLPVEDARRSTLLNVTASDCKGADRKEPSNCAAARALLRELGAKEVRVHLSRVYVKTTPDKWTRYLVPKSMRTEIISFDRGGIFAPGEFPLTAPAPSKRLGSNFHKKKTHKSDARKKHKGRRPHHVVIDVRQGPA